MMWRPNWKITVKVFYINLEISQRSKLLYFSEAWRPRLWAMKPSSLEGVRTHWWSFSLTDFVDVVNELYQNKETKYGFWQCRTLRETQHWWQRGWPCGFQAWQMDPKMISEMMYHFKDSLLTILYGACIHVYIHTHWFLIGRIGN